MRKLTLVGGQLPEPYVPKPQAVPEVVEAAGDTLFLADADPPEAGGGQQVKSQELLQKHAGVLTAEMFQPGLSPQFLLALRIVLQFLLLKLRTPSNILAVAHTPNAAKKLVPAMEALLKGAPILAEEEPRALKDVDLGQVEECTATLVAYREVYKELKLAADCVDAGTAHLEQKLHAVAKAVVPHIVDLCATDRNAADILDDLMTLLTDPIDQAQETKKDRAKVAGAAGQPAPVVVAPQPGTPVGTPAPATPGTATPTPAVATPTVPTTVVLAGAQPTGRPAPAPGRGTKRRK